MSDELRQYVGRTVYWHDPADGLSNGPYEVVDTCGEILYLRNEEGSEAEVFEDEVIPLSAGDYGIPVKRGDKRALLNALSGLDLGGDEPDASGAYGDADKVFSVFFNQYNDGELYESCFDTQDGVEGFLEGGMLAPYFRADVISWR